MGDTWPNPGDWSMGPATALVPPPPSVPAKVMPCYRCGRTKGLPGMDGVHVCAPCHMAGLWGPRLGEPGRMSKRSRRG